MPVLHKVRTALQRLGVDVSRFPSQHPEYRAFRALMSSHPRTLVDVGANAGQFAIEARRFGFDGLLVSLEPGARAFSRLELAAAHDPNWVCHRVAVGDLAEQRTLNVAANEGASSSLLPMLTRHVDAAPGAEYVSTEKVDVVRLESLAAQADRRWLRPALKIDTQGFEREVLSGCGAWLDEVLAVRLELSLVRLYEGSWLWREAVDWLEARGFELGGIATGFSDPRTGRLLQFDGVFVRETGADPGAGAGG